MKPQRTLVIAICSVLFTGFALSSFVSYFLANDTFRKQIREQHLPLTSDNIYSHIQHDLLRPVLVSSLMAQDTFVIDWAKNGEIDHNRIIQYLAKIQKEYNAVTTFYASSQSHRYYHPTGVIKTISKTDKADDWYFDMIDNTAPYTINLDIDTADTTRTTFFVNHKMVDSEGRFLGVIGVGLSSNNIQELIDNYERAFGRTVFFVDQNGQVTLHGDSFSRPLSLEKMPGLNHLAKRILQNPEGAFEYKTNLGDVYVSSRYIEQLDWHIIVEEVATPRESIIKALWLNLLISAVVTLIIGFTISSRLNRYQNKLNQLATKDYLTNISSRQGFEPTFHHMLETARRNSQPLSILLLDLDHFKQVNDNYGHLQGDNVLKQVARILDDNVRQCDIIGRWGGEEFILALAECNITAASTVAEKIRNVITKKITITSNPEEIITASIGVAEFDLKESADGLFSRADKALYRAKNSGRNCVALAPGANQK